MARDAIGLQRETNVRHVYFANDLLLVLLWYREFPSLEFAVLESLSEKVGQ